MEIFDFVQKTMAAKYSGHIQLLNVSDRLVRLSETGPYLMPGHYVVTTWNPIIDRSIKNNRLLEIDFDIESADSKTKRTKKTEDVLVVDVVNDVNDNEQTDIAEVATESEL